MGNTDRTTAVRGIVAAWCALAAVAVVGCHKDSKSGAPAPTASIAVSSPYLEAAVRDVLGPDAPLVQLAGPSMCPGHFDMRPNQLGDLARCRLLLRFDFQQPLDAKLSDALRKNLKIVPITLPGGMCEPDVYRTACQQVAEALTAMGLLQQAVAQRRLSEIEHRLRGLSDDVHRRIASARLRGAAVLASRHQEEFCRWLGLQPVAVFSAQDTAGVGEIDAAVQAGRTAHVTAIVANRPEGRRLADALADRLGAPVAVFDNLPSVGDPRATTPAFDRLVQQNVAALLAAHRSPSSHASP